MKQWVRVIFVSIGMICLGVAGVSDAHASGGAVDRWIDIPVQILDEHETEAPRYDGVPCSGVESKMVLQDAFTDDAACIFGSAGQVRVARYLTRQGEFRYAVSFPYTGTFYPIRGLCEGMARCAYASGSDALLMSSLSYGVNFNTTLYYGFTGMLHKVAAGGATVYEFVAEDEGIVLGTATRHVSTGTAAFSKNGKWAAVEIHRYGVVLIDVTTGEYRRIIAPGAEYGRGNDPTYELAVSNGGALVAVTGIRLGLDVYRVTSGCGDTIHDDSESSFASEAEQCPRVDIDRYSLLPGFHMARAPSFSGDDQILSVSAEYQLGVRRVTLGPVGTRLPESTVRYIALGDSYISGEGETSDTFYIEGTNTSANKCHVSLRSYPLLLGDHWQVSRKSHACSGARIQDILSNNGDIPAQIARIEHEQPELVMIGVGGNDAGLMTKLKGCLGLDTCEWAANGGDRRAVSSEIAALFTPLVDLVRSIKDVASQMKVVLVGYPAIVNESPTGKCDLLSSTLLNREERRFMGESIRYLNKVIEAAARASGALYINIEDSLNGARLCDEGQLGMNAVRVGGDIAPLVQLPKLKVIGAESFHPTPYGHRSVAHAISQSHDWTGLVETRIAPYINLTAPRPGEYWSAGDNGSVPGPELRNIEGRVVHTYAARSLAVQVPTHIFARNSEVRAEIHSNLTRIGTYRTGSDGSFAFSVGVPDDVAVGYHTVHLYGVSISGDKVDAYFSLLIDGESEVLALGATNNTNGATDIEHSAGAVLALRGHTPEAIKGTSVDSPLKAATLGVVDVLSGRGVFKPTASELGSSAKPGNVLGTAMYVTAGLAIILGTIIWLSFRKGRGG